FQNALYINHADPTNAVIFDRQWVLATVAGLGMKLVAAIPPNRRGYQWVLLMTRRSHPRPEIALPEDSAAPGLGRPPLLPPDACTESRVECRVENVYDIVRRRHGLFEIVLFLGVLYHVRNPMLALDRVRGVTRPGGLVFVETQIASEAVAPGGEVPAWRYFP